MIRSFSDACKKLKLDPVKSLPKISGMPKRHQNAVIAQAKLTIITEALNGDWEADWNDSSQLKYYPWFWMNNPGFRFSVSFYTGAAADTGTGSRLCFKTRELSDYAGKKFLTLWRDLMVLPASAKGKRK